MDKKIEVIKKQLFELIWKRTSDLEGFDSVTVDQGGMTKYGICWKWDSEYLIPLGYTKESDVSSLSVEDAKTIYYEKYWIKAKIHNLYKLPRLCMTVFDLHFHEWKGWILFQRVSNFILGTNLVVDNSCGKNTLNAIELLSKSLEFYPKKAFNEKNIAVIAQKIQTEIYYEIFNDPNDTGYQNVVELNSALRRVGEFSKYF